MKTIDYAFFYFFHNNRVRFLADAFCILPALKERRANAGVVPKGGAAGRAFYNSGKPMFAGCNVPALKRKAGLFDPFLNSIPFGFGSFNSRPRFV